MISEETVWQEIWPAVEKLIEATLVEDGPAVKRQLHPQGEAAAIYDLWGVTIFDILLKTVLGRGRLAVTRAIETEKGRHVHVEFVWPDPDAPEGGYTAADLVSAQMRQYRKEWRVVSINPAAADLPLTEPRAQSILLTSKVFSEENKVPAEPWLLPVALFAGNLQIPLRDEALEDEVERLLLPGLQHRTFGIQSLVAGRRLWRDFRRQAKPQLERPAGWAAAVEFIMNEQTMREATQAAVARNYQVGLTQMLPRVRQIKKVLQIKGLDQRYSPLGKTQIVFPQDS